jgi:hypothetical protein
MPSSFNVIGYDKFRTEDSIETIIEKVKDYPSKYDLNNEVDDLYDQIEDIKEDINEIAFKLRDIKTVEHFNKLSDIQQNVFMVFDKYKHQVHEEFEEIMSNEKDYTKKTGYIQFVEDGPFDSPNGTKYKYIPFLGATNRLIIVSIILFLKLLTMTIFEEK